MKKLLILLCGLPVMACAQNTYLIQGKVGAYNAPAKIYLEFFRIGKKADVDSVVLVDGKFKFSGVADSISKAYLAINTKGTGPGSSADYTDLYVEQGVINVSSADSLVHATITGTHTNDDNARFKAATKSVDDEYAAIDAKRKAASPDVIKSDAFLKEEEKENDAASAHYKAITIDFVKNNPNSYVSLKLLEELTYDTDYSTLAPLVNALSPALKQRSAGKDLLAMMPMLKAVSIGNMAPEFTTTDTSGNALSLSSFRGKYVLVDFWASWCGPCRGENPNVVKAYNLYKNKNFTVLGISLDSKKDDWLKAIKADGLTWAQASDLQGWQNKVAKLYGINAIPKNFLIGPDGKIIAATLRGEGLQDKLAEIFGKI